MEGRIIWRSEAVLPLRAPEPADRAARLHLFRATLAAALEQVEAWRAAQATVGGQTLLQQYQDALLDPVWQRRAIALIDREGRPLVEAVRLAAQQVGRQRESLTEATDWLVDRLARPPFPPDAILAAPQLSALAILAAGRPTLLQGEAPPITTTHPLLGEVPGLGPSWAGRIARIQDDTLSFPQGGISVRYEAERQLVCETAWAMKADGLVKLTSGNVSIRIPGTDLFAITPSGMAYEALTPADICLVNLAGDKVEGERRPSSETPLHRAAYVSRPEVNGVVHTHSIYASAFACLGQPMPVISTELAALVGGTIDCAPYAKSGSQEFADVAIQTIGSEALACLFQNHGVLAVGTSLTEAYAIAIGLEEAAQIYYLARSMGDPIILPEEERRRMFSEFRRSYGQPKV
ncbi:MAG TPA: class II aldolase/adducin family protein [Symbiobacteriaceae bacterium]|nr:class II aldolase/adducin family protein [Symbiobacteriaceae bacterium]